MIRMRLWSNGTSYQASASGAATHDLTSDDHISHCVDSLRQALMCSVDITPIPWMWSPLKQETVPVATIQHTCRNFETIRQWAKENHIKNFDSKVFVEDELKA